MVSNKLLGFLALATTLSLFALYSYNSKSESLQAIPQNIKDCEDITYPLHRNSFKTDTEIIPGKSVQMIANFVSQDNGNVEKMLIQVYKAGFKLYTQTVDHKQDYTANNDFDYVFSTRLPSFVPHISVEMKLVFQGAGDTLLNCIAFDLSF